MEAGVQAPGLYIFNPFTEAYFSLGKAFTPTKTQAQMAYDLRSIPQFLCRRGDLVLVPNTPQPSFVRKMEEIGFDVPEFVNMDKQQIPSSHPLRYGKLSSFHPWAWGPDSLELLSPLLPNLTGNPGFFRHIPGWKELYSKCWSLNLLRNFFNDTTRDPVLCTLNDCGDTADDWPSALEIIRMTRSRGHHRVVVKQALGLAGHNAIRLWEPEILEQQRRWITRATEQGPVVVEPWLDRVIDFSIQMQMGDGGLRMLGYTGLVNDIKGQYRANWSEPEFSSEFPEPVRQALGAAKLTALHDAYAALFDRLERELRRLHFIGPIGIDAFVYRLSDGTLRVKPLVEINPRYTMGRLTLELMKRVSGDVTGNLRLVSLPQVKAKTFRSFSEFAAEMARRFPLEFEEQPPRRIRQGFFCLNDPEQAKHVLAVFTANNSSRRIESTWFL